MKKYALQVIFAALLAALLTGGASAADVVVPVPRVDGGTEKLRNIPFGSVMLDINWGKDLFVKDATEGAWNAALAVDALTLSAAAEVSQARVNGVLDLMGFQRGEGIRHNSHYGETFNLDHPGLTIASQWIKVGQGYKTLVAVVLRGTTENFDGLTDAFAAANGFLPAGKNTKRELDEYMRTYYPNNSPENTILLITGHSLGAATGGVLARLISKMPEANDKNAYRGYPYHNNTYVYLFATPNFETEGEEEWPAFYPHVRHFINPDDWVPDNPSNFKKVGKEQYIVYDGLSACRKARVDEYYKTFTGKTYGQSNAAMGLFSGNYERHICEAYMALLLDLVEQRVQNSQPAEHMQVRAEVDGNSATVSWTPPAGAGQVRYTVKWFAGGVPNYWTTTGTSCLFDNLAKGSYRVNVYGGGGAGGVNFTIDHELPVDMPRIEITGISSSGSTVTVAWRVEHFEETAVDSWYVGLVNEWGEETNAGWDTVIANDKRSATIENVVGGLYHATVRCYRQTNGESICSAPAEVAVDYGSGSCGAGLSWVENGYGTLRVFGSGEMTSAPWLQDWQCQNRMTEAILPEGLTGICENAFESCSLQEIMLPESLRSIGPGAFRYSALHWVDVPGGVSLIGANAFLRCQSLAGVNLRSGIREIGAGAFSYCTTLRSLTIPGSVSRVGASAFSECRALETLVLEQGVTELGGQAFGRCTSLTSVSLPNSLRSTYAFSGGSAFAYCDGLQTAGPASGVYNVRLGWKDAIPEKALYGMHDLRTLVIPSGVRTIGAEAFHLCYRLTSVVLPDSLTALGEGAFTACESLESINIPAGVAMSAGFRLNKCVDGRLYSLGPAGGPYNIQLSLTGELPEDYFADCFLLETVVLPDGVTAVGARAFERCTSLKSVTLPGSVKRIENNAFDQCLGLEGITLPEGVKRIDWAAFGSCNSLKSVSLPASLELIQDAFYWCDELRDVYYAGSEADWSQLTMWQQGIIPANATIHYGAAPDLSPGTEHDAAFGSVTIRAAQIEARVDAASAAGGAQLWCAQYGADGRMLGARLYAVTAGRENAFAVPRLSTAWRTKLLLTGPGLAPLCEAAEVPLKEERPLEDVNDE